MPNRHLIGAALALFVAAGAWWFIQGPHGAPDPRGGSGSLDEAPLTPQRSAATFEELRDSATPAATSGARSAASNESSDTRAESSKTDGVELRRVVGRVVERGGRGPVAAWIRVAPGPSVVSQPWTGAFELDVALGPTATLVVEHPDYERFELALPEAPTGGGSSTPGEGSTWLPHEPPVPSDFDVGLLELVPRAMTSVRVVDTFGLAIGGARAELRAHVPEAQDASRTCPPTASAPLPLGVTDDSGAVRFALAQPAVCWVEAPDGRIGALLVRGGEEAVLALDGPPRHARVLREGERTPIVGRTFPFRFTRGPRSATLLLTSDEDGRIALPCGPCELGIWKSEPRLLLAAVELAEGSTTKFTVREFEAFGVVAPEDSELIVLVRDEEHELRLLDGTTGAAINGCAWMQNLYQRSAGGPKSGPAASNCEPVRNGVVLVGSWFAEPEEPGSTTTRCLAVAGFEVAHFGPEVDLRQGEVHLTPGPARGLRLVDGAGNNLSHPFQLSTSSGPSYMHWALVGGITGPFPWQRGDTWTIHVFGSSEPHVIPAEELAAHEVVTVQLGAEYGGLVVTGVPDGAPPLFAVAATGQWHPLAVMDGTAGADTLPAGEYGLGTRSWIDGCGSGLGPNERGGALPAPADRVVIEAAVVTQMAWNEAWWERAPLRGQITCDGVDPQELFVLPINGSLAAFVGVGPSTSGLPVAADGRFTVPAGGARPSGFAFVRHLAGRGAGGGTATVFLDVQPLAQDGNYTLRCTSFELHAAQGTGKPGRVVSVHLIFDRALLSAPTVTASGVYFAWDTGAPFSAGGLPTNVRALGVGGRGVPDIALQPGRFSRVEVVLPPVADVPSPGTGHRPALGGG